jgi:glutamyl-tRNA reductase
MEDWAERVRKYELGYALQQLAKGQDVNIVMEAMAARIQQKILHPIIIEIKKSSEK